MNEIVKTDTKELDCIMAVTTKPKLILLYSLFVDFCKILSNVPPEKILKPSSRVNIPNKKMATPADISLKSGLIHKPQDRIINIKGNKIFSYKVGTGSNDTELGFPLSYRTIENSGDIVFDFNLLSDTYQYEVLTDVLNVSTDTGLLRKYSDRQTFVAKSGWIKAPMKSRQPVVQQPAVNARTNNFIIDVYNNSANLNNLEIIRNNTS